MGRAISGAQTPGIAFGIAEVVWDDGKAHWVVVACTVSDGRIPILDPAYGLKCVRLAAAKIQYTPEAGAIGQFAEHAILTND